MTAQVKLFPVDFQEGNHQVSNISGLTGGMAGQPAPNASDDESDAQAVLDSLRAQYETLRDDVAAALTKRAEQASQIATDGADALRSQIRAAPVTSLAMAAVVGGLVAVLISQRRHEPTWQEKAAQYGSSLRDIDVSNLADRLRRTANETYVSARDQAAGFVPTVERLAQTLATMDASSFSPAIEKGTSWLRSVWNGIAPNAKV